MVQFKQAIIAAFANDLYWKCVVCTETDISFQRGADIMWALSRESGADLDIVVFLAWSARTSTYPPSGRAYLSTSAWMRPAEELPFRAAKVPGEIINRIRLGDYIGDLQICM